VATFNKEQLDTALAEVVTAHVHHQLHVGVAVARRLTAGTHRLHFNAGFRCSLQKGGKKCTLKYNKSCLPMTTTEQAYDTLGKNKTSSFQSINFTVINIHYSRTIFNTLNTCAEKWEQDSVFFAFYLSNIYRISL
jgi:hypothetical protein